MLELTLDGDRRAVWRCGCKVPDVCPSDVVWLFADGHELQFLWGIFKELPDHMGDGARIVEFAQREAQDVWWRVLAEHGEI
ncbi:MAG: hypothetical protein ACYTBJ_21750 [Planctomycetota bacterium]|jgi:hypothetical protein